MRRAGKVVAEMHEVCIARPRCRARRTADVDARRPARCSSAAGRPLQLPRLPRVPRGGVHVAQRRDRARHPERPVVLEEGDILSIDCGAIIEGWHADAAVTVPVGEIDDESKRLIEVTRAVARGGDRRQVVAGNRLGDIGAAVGGGGRRRPGSPWCASTSATASAPRCTRTRRSPTTGRPGRGLRLKAGTCSPSSRW